MIRFWCIQGGLWLKLTVLVKNGFDATAPYYVTYPCNTAVYKQYMLYDMRGNKLLGPGPSSPRTFLSRKCDITKKWHIFINQTRYKEFWIVKRG